MGIRPNREPPQERVQILSVTPKGWAERQGIQVADHWLMINHKHTTTLPREALGVGERLTWCLGNG